MNITGGVLIDPPEPPAREADDPSLHKITLGVHHDDAIDAPIPEVQATTEDRFKDSDMSGVTHVVIQVTIPRQTDIFRYIGYQYDWNYPSPFWHFLGKLVAKAVFDNKTELHEFNFIAIGRREFIAFTTSMWRATVEAEKAAAGTATQPELPPFSVIEVNFKKPQPGKPLEMTWAPARDLFTNKIRQWSEIDKVYPYNVTAEAESPQSDEDVGSVDSSETQAQ